MRINKKAQAPLGLLPIIAIVLSAAALFTMLTFSKDFTNQSSLLSEMTKELDLNYQYIVAQSDLIAKKSFADCQPSCDEAKLKSLFITLSTEAETLYKLPGAGNFYGKIRNSEFEVTESKTGYNITISDLFVESVKEDNKITRDFNLEITLK